MDQISLPPYNRLVFHTQYMAPQFSHCSNTTDSIIKVFITYKHFSLHISISCNWRVIKVLRQTSLFYIIITALTPILYTNGLILTRPILNILCLSSMPSRPTLNILISKLLCFPFTQHSWTYSLYDHCINFNICISNVNLQNKYKKCKDTYKNTNKIWNVSCNICKPSELERATKWNG
jgi:hypothetical protein